MPINVLIFSRDRAMQLDALLRSFFAHCQDCDQVELKVLFLTSNNQHERQYELLKTTYPQICFLHQKDFRQDVIELINPYSVGSLARKIFDLTNSYIAPLFLLEGIPKSVIRRMLYRIYWGLISIILPSPPEDSQILFLVDDNIFVKDFSLNQILKVVQIHGDAIGFSLRLGRNTTYCYALDRTQPLPNFNVINDGVLKFDWTNSELDFAYPLEVSSSVYRIKDILPVILSSSFGNPNELELKLAISAKGLIKNMPFLLCPVQSYTFCNPINLVQTSVKNRAGSSLIYTSEYLAEMFDQNFRICVNKFNDFVPQSCHQEVPLEFYQPTA